MRSLLIIVLLATAVFALSDKERARQALRNPDLFQGDILGFEPGDRTVIADQQKRWPGGVIPYVIDSSLARYKFFIQEAMEEYHKNTCVRFVPRSTEKNYIKIFMGQGCYSLVGMAGTGEQPLSLGKDCHYKGVIIHELGHAVGFFHEQNRSDRNKYLLILWDNIQAGMEVQFVKVRKDDNHLLTPFDYDSIMIYGNYAFSVLPKKLMTMKAIRKKKLLKDPFEKSGMTKSDIKRVNKMYNCESEKKEKE